MPTKTKPKWGWKNAGTFMPFFCSDDELKKPVPNRIIKDQLERIVNTLCLPKIPRNLTTQLYSRNSKFLKAFRELEKATENYRINKNRKIPRLSEVRAALMAIHDKAKRLDKPKPLIKVLERIDDWTLDKLAMTSFPDNLDFFDRPWNNPDIQVRVYSVVQEALSELEKDKGGLPPNNALIKLIIELKEIYEEASNKKAAIPYWNDYKKEFLGPFLDFVYAFLEIINPDEIGKRSSLAQKVKKILISSKSKKS